MEELEKAKLVSELYDKKSKYLSSLSDLSDSQKIFTIGTRYLRDFYGHVNEIHLLNSSFLKKVKQMTIDEINYQIELIDNQLKELLKCN